MAEYKKTWANKFKKWRQKEGLTISEFVNDILQTEGTKKYRAIEDGRSAPSNYLKQVWRSENT